MSTIPVQQNNSVPLNLTSLIPTSLQAGLSTVTGQLPSLAATSPIYERVMAQMGGGHVFRLQRNGVTIASGILEADVSFDWVSRYSPSATARLASGVASAGGSKATAVLSGVGSAVGSRFGGKLGAAIGGIGGSIAGGIVGKLLSANKAASALGWDFQDGNYWRQELAFTLIRAGTTGEEDVLTRYSRCAEMVLSQESAGVFTGPYGTSLDGQFYDSLGLSLLVGNWLVIDDLIATGISASMSRVTTVDDKPYMSNVRLKLQTRTAVSHNIDLKRWLSIT